MRRERLIHLALLLATAAAYWPVVCCGFVNYDDWAYVTGNPFVRQGLAPASLSYAFQSKMLGNWHPATWLSHMLVCQWFGLNAAAHHLVNVGLHAANTLLLFHLLQRMTRKLWPSALVAALFALHPLHVESVAWIAERKDVLSTLFGLLTIQTYLRYLSNKEGSNQKATGGSRKAEDRRQRTEDGRQTSGPPSSVFRPLSSGYYWLAVLYFALGLMSKPMLVTWPFVLLLLDYWPLGRMAGATSPAWTRGSASQPGPGGQGASKVRKVLFQRAGSPIPKTPLGATLLRLVWEKLPFFALSIASCTITLVTQRNAGAMPDSGLLSFATSLNNALVSYVRYLGKTFWPFHLAVCYPYQFDRPDWEIAGSALILVLITIGALWQSRRRPYLIFGWLWFLGTLVPVIGLVQAGGQSMADRYMYIPSIGLFLMIVWGTKDLLGRWPLASRKVGVAAATAALLGCLILTLNQLRYWRDGGQLFRHALNVTTDNMIAEYGYSEFLVQHGEISEGLQHLEHAIQISPKHVPTMLRIADLWSRQGKIREAIDKYREVLSYRPNVVPALNNLAWILATSEDPGIRDGAEAVRLAEHACEGMAYGPPSMIPSDLDTLAAAYAEVGRYKDAVKTAERARAFALAAGEKERAEKIRRTIELYRAGKPLHQRIDNVFPKIDPPDTPS
jgi:tetratricopeptide (TPR) repeat protein